MKLALRNLAAEWFLEALGEGDGARLDALIAYAGTADSAGEASLPAHARALLEEAAPFEAVGDRVRLREEFVRDLPALRDRTERFAAAREALAACRESTAGGEALDRTVAVAAVLFDHGLFFEVHELLEPSWLRAEGGTRAFLQGLIQVAVGLHHHQHDNLRGALSLLSEGNAKLFEHLPAAHGLDLTAACRDVESFATKLRHRMAGDARLENVPYPSLRRAAPG